MSRESRDILLERIHSWLDQERQSTGGWAEITDDDISELWHIIDELIHLKCQKDPDGDVPIEFTLVDRTKYERMHFHAVPYDREVGTEQERFDVVRGHWANASIATNRLDQAMRMYEFYRRQTTEKSSE